MHHAIAAPMTPQRWVNAMTAGMSTQSSAVFKASVTRVMPCANCKAYDMYVMPCKATPAESKAAMGAVCLANSGLPVQTWMMGSPKIPSTMAAGNNKLASSRFDVW